MQGSAEELCTQTLELPNELKDFWFPVAFSSQLKQDAMVTMELFGEPWVMFQGCSGARGLREGCLCT